MTRSESVSRQRTLAPSLDIVSLFRDFHDKKRRDMLYILENTVHGTLFGRLRERERLGERD